MDLETMKLVTFAILMEYGEGIMGKERRYIAEKFSTTQSCGSLDHLRGMLDDVNQCKFDNYLSVWSAEAEEPAPDSEDDTVEITESGIQAVELEPGTMTPLPITEKPAEDPRAQAPGKSESKRGKRGR